MSRVLYETRARIQAAVRTTSAMVGTSGVSLHGLTPTSTPSGLVNPPRLAPVTIRVKAASNGKPPPWYRQFGRKPYR